MDKTGILIDPVNEILVCGDCLLEIYKAWQEDDTDLLSAIGSEEEVMSRYVIDNFLLMKYTKCSICGRARITVKIRGYVCYDCIGELYYAWIKRNFDNINKIFKAKDVDSYLRKYSKEHNIIQDYIVEAVNKVRYKTKDKKGD